MSESRRRRTCGATVLLIVAWLAMPAIAGWRVSAHAQLVASSPGAGEVVATAPDRLVLIFSEPLEDTFTSIDLADAAGAVIVSSAGSVDPDDRHQLVAEIPALVDGVYTVHWQSLSAADGHTADGFFSFGVGEASSVPPGSSGHGGFEPDAATTIGRWFGYLGLLAGFGLPFIAVLVLRQPPRVLIVRLVGGLLLLSAAATLALAFKAAATVEGADVGAYLFGSRNGGLQTARTGLLAAGGVAVIALAGRHIRPAMFTAGGAALGGIVLLISAGHASALPGFGSTVVQVVHVAAAGVWATGVVLLAAVGIQPALVTRQREPLVRCVPRFSALALASIGLVGVTGFYASWSQTGYLLDPATDYGRVLIVKLALAVGALAVGALNFLFGERAVRWVIGLRTRLMVEVALALGVLLATGLLSATTPIESARGVAIAPVPNAFGSVLPGMSLELLPGRTGVNQVAVSAEGAMATATMELLLDRLDTGGQTRIPLRHVRGGGAMPGMPGMEHGATPDEGGPARFVADAVVLPPGSHWDASVLILSEPGGSELSRQRYSFAMDDSGVTVGRRATSFVDIGLMFAAMLAVGGALSIGLGMGGMKLPRCDAAVSRVALNGGGLVAVSLGLLLAIEHLAVLG